MSGIIYCDKIFDPDNYITDRYDCLFRAIEDRLGWMLVYGRKFKPKTIKSDWLMTFKLPQGKTAKVAEDVPNIDPKVKLISYFTDLHDKGNPDYFKIMRRVLERSNIVLTAYWEEFCKKWPEFVHKSIWFPHYYAPIKRYDDLPFNTNPVMECVLTGCRAKYYYPLRNYLASNHRRFSACKIHIIEPPDYHPEVMNALADEKCLRWRYTQTLNKYFAGVTDCASTNYVVAKYLEIPATGSLLIANSCPDLNDLGFKPGIHYVEINKENCFEKIEHVMKNPDLYNQIRIDGRKFVQENFNMNIGVEKFIKIVEEYEDV